MRTRLLRSLAVVLTLTLAAAACGDRSAPKADVTPADVVAGAVPSVEHYESALGRFSMDLPDTWRGAYTIVERNDTTMGARFAAEFVFKPAADSKVEPKTLMVLRVFPKSAWNRIAARPGPPIAAKIAEKGDDVFAVSYPASNPYPPGTPAAVRFDSLVLAVIQPKAPMRFTPR